MSGELEVLADMNAMLLRDNVRYRKAGNALAAAAIHVANEYDGVHRLMLAASEWALAVANEGDRARKAGIEVVEVGT